KVIYMLSRTILRAQNSPHIVHISFWAVGLLSRYFLGLSWSNASWYCFSQSNSFLALAISNSLAHAPLHPLETSAACAAIFDAITPSLTSCNPGMDRCSAGVT